MMVRHHGGADGLCEGCRKPHPCPPILLQPLRHALDDRQSPCAEQFVAFISVDDEVLARCRLRGDEVRLPELIAPYRSLEREQQWQATLSEHRAKRSEAS
jgi:hypothetical protein